MTVLFATAVRGFLAIAILGQTLSPAAAPKSTLVNIAKIRDAWVQDLRTKQLEPILKVYAPDAALRSIQSYGDAAAPNVDAQPKRQDHNILAASFVRRLSLGTVGREGWPATPL